MNTRRDHTLTRRRALALGALAGLGPAARPALARDDGDSALGHRLDRALEAALAARKIVGAVVVVLRDGRPVYRHAAGLADREASTPMRADQAFRLASISKPLVTAAALRLVDQKRLRLEDPVTRHLPFRPRLPDGSQPPITVRQLLNHTAGLSYGFLESAEGPYHRARVSDGLDASAVSLTENLARIERAGLAYPPGTRWGYSVAIDVLGAVIERVTSQTLPAAVAALVTGPLGLSAGFAAPQRLATPYADGTPPVRMTEPHVVPFMGLAGISFSPARALDPHAFPSGGAGMNGTADDVARFLEVIRKGGAPILEPATAQAMATNQTGALPIIFGPGWGFGFGGAVLLDPAAASSPQSPGTFSWGGAWGHSWFVDPRRRLVVVGLTNTAVEGMVGAFPGQVRDAVYGARTG